MSIPPATEMFQFAGFASRAYEFSTGYPLKSCPLGVGCPIRRSRDQRSLASPPGFSQRAASFIASQCQGIHQMPLIRARSAGIPKRSCPPGNAPENRRAQGQAPSAENSSDQGKPQAQPSHEDTSFGPAPPTGSRLRPRPVRLGHIHKSASPFNQRQPRNRTSHAGRPASDARGSSPGTATGRHGTKPLLLRTSLRRPPRPRRPRPRHRSAPRPCGASRPGNGEPTLVEVNGIEPMTSCLQSRRSPN
jgi:hypothetical protein